MKTLLDAFIYSLINAHFIMGELQMHGLPSDVHHCTSHREGEWITWRCPQCDDYERKLNWKTGEMRVRRGNSIAQHTGMSTRVHNMEALQRGLADN